MLEYGYINENGYMTSKILEPITETRRDENEELKEYVVSIEEQAAFLYDRGWKPVETIDDTKLTTAEGSYYSVSIIPVDKGETIGYNYDKRISTGLVMAEISSLKRQLAADDYKITKCYEASLLQEVLPYNVVQLHELRNKLRIKVNELEELLKANS